MIEMNVARGDITLIPADVIVNAANSSLLGGGGVDGAIHRKGGPDILDECKKIRARQGGCAVGDAVVTTAGKLPAQYVIHAVGPTWQGGEKHEPELLRKTYLACLQLARSLHVESISFPNISTGTYRFPSHLRRPSRWKLFVPFRARRARSRRSTSSVLKKRAMKNIASCWAGRYLRFANESGS